MSGKSVLLIFPPDKWGNIDRFCQPLGVLTLATVLQQEGIDVTVVDLAAEGWSPKKMIDFITNGDFTHVGATILTPFRKVPYSILKIAKKIDPSITTLAGGPHVTYLKEKVLSECSAIDIAVAGEAELKMADIIRNPTKKCYDLGYVEDIDSLPIPDRSLVRHIKYDRMNNIWIGDSASMKWVRGCPWRKCRFCSRHEITMFPRRRSPEKIVEEIAVIQNELKYKNIVVADDSLRVNSKHTKKVLSLKIKEGLDIPFWSLARADHMDKEGMRLMRKAGATGIQIGLESVVPRMIHMYQKTSEHPNKWCQTLDHALNLADKYNIVIIASFIVGGPYETAEEIYKTFNYCRTSKLDIAQPFPFLFLVGSDFWKDAVAKGQISPDQLYTYNDKSYGTTEFSTDEIFELAMEAEHLINSAVVNPKRYWRLFRKLVKQNNWGLIGQNFIRVPLIVRDLLQAHPYEMVPEELHG